MRSKIEGKFRLWFLLRGLGVGLYLCVAAEMFLRTLQPVPMLPRYVEAKPYGVRGNSGDTHYWHRSPDYALEMRMNSQGVRADREIPYRKPPGVVRIVLLGDSFSVGHGATLEETFIVQAETILRRQGHSVEVVNMAVSGHGTAEELVTLKAEGLRYEPDFVVIGWHPTDLRDTVRSNLFALEKGKVVTRQSSYLPAVKLRSFLFSFAAYRWLAGDSHLYNWLRTRGGEFAQGQLYRLRKRFGGSSRVDALPAVSTPPGLSNSERLNIALLAQMRTIAQENNAKLIVVDIPFSRPGPSYVSGFPEDPRQLHHGFSVVDPVTEFEANSDKLLYWENSHNHFTPLGNRIVGRALASMISEML